jgi:hypothetical protein
LKAKCERSERKHSGNRNRLGNANQTIRLKEKQGIQAGQEEEFDAHSWRLTSGSIALTEVPVLHGGGSRHVLEFPRSISEELSRDHFPSLPIRRRRVTVDGKSL